MGDIYANHKVFSFKFLGRSDHENRSISTSIAPGEAGEISTPAIWTAIELEMDVCRFQHTHLAENLENQPPIVASGIINRLSISDLHMIQPDGTLFAPP